MGKDGLSRLVQPGGAEGIGRLGRAELAADGGGPLRLRGEGEPVFSLPPPESGIHRGVPEGQGGLQDIFQIVKGEPAGAHGADMGKDQDTEAPRLRPDLH